MSYLRPLTAMLLFLAFAAQAEGIKITPGKWQIQMTSTMSIMPQPMSKTLEECISAEQLSPAQLMKDSGSCKVSDIKSTRSDLTWKMVCMNHGGEMAGTGKFTSTGDQMNGTLDLGMDLNGQPLQILTKWSGKRVGACK